MRYGTRFFLFFLLVSAARSWCDTFESEYALHLDWRNADWIYQVSGESDPAVVNTLNFSPKFRHSNFTGAFSLSANLLSVSAIESARLDNAFLGYNLNGLFSLEAGKKIVSYGTLLFGNFLSLGPLVGNLRTRGEEAINSFSVGAYSPVGYLSYVFFPARDLSYSSHALAFQGSVGPADLDAVGGLYYFEEPDPARASSYLHHRRYFIGASLDAVIGAFRLAGQFLVQDGRDRLSVDSSGMTSVRDSATYFSAGGGFTLDLSGGISAIAEYRYLSAGYAPEEANRVVDYLAARLATLIPEELFSNWLGRKYAIVSLKKTGLFNSALAAPDSLSLIGEFDAENAISRATLAYSIRLTNELSFEARFTNTHAFDSGKRAIRLYPYANEIGLRLSTAF
jgi:hypothetical protein